MTYQLTIEIESDRSPDEIAREAQAALGAWGIDSANPVVRLTAVAEERRRCDEFSRQIKALVDGSI